MIDSDSTGTSRLAGDNADDDAVVGSPLKLHDYLAELQLSQVPLSSTATVSRRPVCEKDARSVCQADLPYLSDIIMSK